MFITTYKQAKRLKHGQKVMCRIKDIDIRDAKISISENGDIYICQNLIGEFKPDYTLGYKNSWPIYPNLKPELVTIEDLRTVDGEGLLESDLKDIEPGDILVDTDQNEYKVLEVFDNTFLLSEDDDFTLPGGLYTFEGADKDGFKLKEVEPKEEVKEDKLPRFEVPVRSIYDGFAKMKKLEDSLEEFCRKAVRKSELQDVPKEELIKTIIELENRLINRLK